jgi:hypothetical protein
MNFFQSIAIYKSTRHWSRYAWFEKWKCNVLSGIQEPRIVDIGAGHNPFHDATHIVELYPEDNTQRARDMVPGRRTLIHSSVEEIPVEDEFFPFRMPAMCLSTLMTHTKHAMKLCV